jgi:hypothetical protein
MNEQPLNDPKLVALEARLAALVPSVSPIEQQRLLYECGFAAGRRAAGKSVRLWQAAAAALVVVALGLCVPLAQDRLLVP